MIAKQIINEPGLALSRLGLAFLLLALAATGCNRGGGARFELPSGDAPPVPEIRLNESKSAFEVIVAAEPSELAHLAAWSPEQWGELFAVYVDSKPANENNQLPPMVGTYRVEENRLCFEPRFPLTPGVSYKAVLHRSKLPGAHQSKHGPVVATFTLPKKQTPPTVVEHIYPTADTLPENQLKFYIHFSAPMSQGEAYERIHLLNSQGDAVESPFYELVGELWDTKQQRFTLFLHPGRSKAGLKLREELGPVLEAGKQYTLVIDQKWGDANGNPLGQSYRKCFMAAAAENQAIDPKKWKIEAPLAGKTEPVTVKFDKPLDHAHLQRMLWVVDGKGNRQPGKMTVGAAEKEWHFTPEKPWEAGDYRLILDPSLEDLAGNSVGEMFALDQFRTTGRSGESKTFELRFAIQR